MEDDGNEDGSSSSVRLAGSSVGAGEFRWVDGSEVDSESPPWSLDDDASANKEDYGGSIRRRLIKKPKRVDSLDVESMEIAGSSGHHNKVKRCINPLVFSSIICHTH